MENQKDPPKGLFCNQINLKIMLKYFPLIISSVISSIILFQSFLIAPTINKQIDNIVVQIDKELNEAKARFNDKIKEREETKNKI